MQFDIVKELTVIALREQPLPADMVMADTPDKVAEFWRTAIASQPRYNPEVENFVALFLNTRRRIKGFQIISQGTADTLLVHPREVFRVAIIVAAAAVIIMHNHPSGESSPSEADIKVTRDLIRAGQLLKMELLDHVIIGNQQRTSLRECGYFIS